MDKYTNKYMKKYKNLVFDVGSVLVGYRWRDMLTDHGLTEDEADKYGKMIFRDPLWLHLDMEDISYQDVVERYVEEYPEHEELTRWFFRHPEKMSVSRNEIWKKVARLREKGYRIYILSNYSSVLFEAHTKGASFRDNLDGKVISYMIHKIKPEPEIYQYLFSEYDLDPEESVFFDDREENVLASAKNGMDAVRILSEQHLDTLLDQLLTKDVMNDPENCMYRASDII